MNVTLVGQKMFRFTQICRRGQRMFEIGSGFGKIVICQRSPPQCQLGANMLAERTAFTAFPRLELAIRDELASLVVPARLIVKRAQFDAQIVTLLNETRMPLQLSQALRRFFAETFPKLVAFEEQPGVG